MQACEPIIQTFCHVSPEETRTLTAIMMSRDHMDTYDIINMYPPPPGCSR